MSSNVWGSPRVWLSINQLTLGSLSHSRSSLGDTHSSSEASSIDRQLELIQWHVTCGNSGGRILMAAVRKEDHVGTVFVRLCIFLNVKFLVHHLKCKCPVTCNSSSTILRQVFWWKGGLWWILFDVRTSDSRSPCDAFSSYSVRHTILSIGVSYIGGSSKIVNGSY